MLVGLGRPDDGYMNEAPKPASDNETKTKSSDEERLRLLQQYIESLKDFLRKLGKHFH
jgi:hypothetical protein